MSLVEALRVAEKDKLEHNCSTRAVALVVLLKEVKRLNRKLKKDSANEEHY